MEIQLRSHRSCFVYRVSCAYFRHNTSCNETRFYIIVLRAVKIFMFFLFAIWFTLKIWKNIKNPSSMNEKLRKTIKDLIKITHFHKRIILHKIFKLNQRMSLSHEKRSIFPKTKYDHLPYLIFIDICKNFTIIDNISNSW